MAATYAEAFAPGTVQNKDRQARAYITFMMAYQFDFKQPSVTALLMFIQCLANTYKNTTTVRNYLSGAKSLVTNIAGHTAPFYAPELSNMLKAINRISTHVPVQAPELPLSCIKSVYDVLAVNSLHSQTARAAILMGYASFLRQSNLLPSASLLHGHCLRRSDVEDAGDTLWLHIRSTKTLRDPRCSVSIPVLQVASPYCPVAAWRAYITRVPLRPDAPAFMLNKATPLTPARLLAYLRPALAAIDYPAPHLVTVHSLRRSGARQSARMGAPEADVMTHGTWSSAAVRAYVPKRLYSAVPEAIKKCLANKAQRR